MTLADWQAHSLHAGAGAATEGVWRIAGTGVDGDARVPWSLVLKILSPAASGLVAASREENHVLYWAREARVYESGLVADLPPGFRAAHCYAVEVRPDQCIWLWLEDVGHGAASRWTLAFYAAAARGLAQFNGRYVTGRPWPTHPWLVSDGSPRGVLNHFAWIAEMVADPATWQHPMLRSAFRIPVASRLGQLWADRNTLLDIVDRLPRTLCHMDAWPGNIFAPQGPDGELVAIDWAYTGFAALATDAADLAVGGFTMPRGEMPSPRAVDAAVFENYWQALQHSGWSRDRRALRFAYAAIGALKYGGLALWLRDVSDPTRHEYWERASGLPMQAFLHAQAELIYYLLDLLDEARALASII